jgi:hypothetical protein
MMLFLPRLSADFASSLLGLIADPKKGTRELTVNQSAQLTGCTADDGFQKQNVADAVDFQTTQPNRNR